MNELLNDSYLLPSRMREKLPTDGVAVRIDTSKRRFSNLPDDHQGVEQKVKVHRHQGRGVA